ncbi:MAG: hypothetical protein KatS3mg102_2238 [Planctomycetota bacterium]|nr:MAG: hypothetical protein KatS3mg102_2238 [Planctomycetota bacterium]
MPAPSRADEVFSEIALRHKLLTRQQINEALRLLRRGEKGVRSLGDAIEKKRFLSPGTVRAIRRAVEFREERLRGKLYGRIAIKNGFATLEQVQACLAEQKKLYQERKPVPPLGELMRKHGFVTEVQDHAIRAAMDKLDAEALVARREEARAAQPASAGTAAAPEDKLERMGDAAAGIEVLEPLEEEGEEDEEAELAQADTEAQPPATAGAPAAIAQAAVGAAAGTGSKPVREEETRDELDALLQPDDLRLGDTSESERRAAAVAAARAAARATPAPSPSPSGESAPSSEDLSLPEDFAQQPASAASTTARAESDLVAELEDLEDLEELEEVDDLLPEAALEPAAGAALVVGSPRRLIECPQCKVELSAETTECLYCGYRFQPAGQGGGRAAERFGKGRGGRDRTGHGPARGADTGAARGAVRGGILRRRDPGLRPPGHARAGAALRLRAELSGLALSGGDGPGGRADRGLSRRRRAAARARPAAHARSAVAGPRQRGPVCGL